MLISILFGIATTAFIIWLYQQIKEGGKQLATTIAMCDASEAFWDWQHRNQGVYIGLSPEGRKLLLRYIRAYDEWLISHNNTDRSHYDLLVSLLNDFPPNEPNDIPPGVPKKPRDNIKGLLFYFLDFPTALGHTAQTKEASGGLFCFPHRLLPVPVFRGKSGHGIVLARAVSSAG